MNHILYLECYAGISGDMTVAALLDLGADQAVLEKALASLPLSGFEIKVQRVKKAGLDACDFHVILDEVHENHDHDMAYLHGNEPHTGHTHSHGKHAVEACKNKVKHAHVHRGLAEIVELIGQAAISGRAKTLATRIFTILAEAEAKAHGTSLEEVHFHEVGAVDSIVDIVAVAVCLDNLDITEVVVSDLYEGRGFVRCQHGEIPVPVPAVTHIAAAERLYLRFTDTEGELVTPTGAAIAAAIRTMDRLPERVLLKKTGIGAGKRQYKRPSLLRAMVLESQAESETDVIYKLESTIDDSSGEVLGFVQEQLFAAGARDVYYTPVLMKKNRPAYQVSIVCDPQDVETMQQILFHETTTIGVRRVRMERSILPREQIVVQTPLGEAKVKVCTLQRGKVYYPEYESVVALCKLHALSYQDVYYRIMQACKR